MGFTFLEAEEFVRAPFLDEVDGEAPVPHS
jgi:hypothetical protein